MTDRTHSQRHWVLSLSFSIAMIGALLGGCAREDYHCDATGCYFCDGVGCRPANPPSRNTCTSNAQCPATQTCTNLGCAVRCNSNAECARGWICRGGAGADAGSGNPTGLCVAPTESVTPTPGHCAINADCANGLVCIDGTCTVSTQPACTSDAQCTNGQVCVAGRCTSSTNTCQFNNQCGAGRVCVNSTCRAACSATSPCGTGQECVNGVCRDRTDGCTSDAMCGANHRCINGTCYQSCTPGSATSTCPTSDLYCSDDGACVPDTRPHPFCDAEHPCGAGSQCISGVCRVPCSTNDQCARVDVSYRNCGPIPYQPSAGTFCLTDHESRPLCTRQMDCSATQACIDAICQ